MKKGKVCSACGTYHKDHSAVHFSWMGDDDIPLCFSRNHDHNPMEGDFLVSNDIRKVDCEACKKDFPDFE